LQGQLACLSKPDYGRGGHGAILQPSDPSWNVDAHLHPCPCPEWFPCFLPVFARELFDGARTGHACLDGDGLGRNYWGGPTETRLRWTATIRKDLCFSRSNVPASPNGPVRVTTSAREV